MSDTVRTRRLSFLVSVLTGLVAAMYADTMTAGIPWIWVGLVIRFLCIVGAAFAVARYLYGGKESHDEVISMSQVHPIAGFVIHHTPSGVAITCFRCGMTSYNVNDIQNLWCGKCKEYHHQLPPSVWEAN